MIAGRPVGGDAARHAARAELQHSEYHRDDPGVISRVVHWIGRHLADLLHGGGGAHALLIAFVAIVAVLIVFAVRAGLPQRAARSDVATGVDPLAPIPARDHRRIAAQLAAEGRRAEALREWLRAAVATIEERGVLPARPGRTGAATAREAGPLLPAAAADLLTATRAFDEVWFGGREASDADVTSAHAAADAVRTARLVHGIETNGLAVPQ